jgi:ferredoxin-nitrite reductase
MPVKPIRAGGPTLRTSRRDKVIASGKKRRPGKFKRDEHPFDAYPRLKQQALDRAAQSGG